MPEHEDHSRPAAETRRGGIRLGHILGIPVRLSPSWLVLAVLVTVVYGVQVGAMRPELAGGTSYALGAAFVACLLVSVLLHEVGHAVVSRRLGTGVRGITLELLGGYTEMERDAPRPGVEAAVSLAGPLVSFALAAVAGAGAAAVSAMDPGGSPAAEFLGQVAVSNAIIAVFNALPGLPLDGGRALHALIWAVTGDRHRGRRVAGYAGVVLAVAVTAAAVVLYLTDWLREAGAVFSLVVAASIGFGGLSAVRLGRAGARLHLLAVDRLTRPIFAVPAGTTIGEAYRLAADAGRAGAVFGVVDPAGRLWAVVPEAEDTAVPAERRDAVEVDAVARLVGAYRSLPAGLTGDDVLAAVEADPVGDYLVTAGEDVVGVLRVADVARVLEPRVRETRVLQPRRSGS
jgi:Zn-dependent protease